MFSRSLIWGNLYFRMFQKKSPLENGATNSFVTIMSTQTLPFRKTVPLLVAQLLAAFNDNAVKAFLPLLAAYEIGKGTMDLVNQQVSILLILPFILFAPFAGWVADRYEKRKVVGISLLAQIIGLLCILLGISSKSLSFTLAGFFLLSTQSTFLSPAKKGMLKEMVGSNLLGKAVGWMEMLTILGILGGAFAGAVLFDQLVVGQGGWDAAYELSLSVVLLALVSWLVFLPTPATKAAKAGPFQAMILVHHFQDLSILLKRPNLRWAALGDACFWAVGGFFYLVLVKLSGEVIEGREGMGSLYGYWFLLLGVGIMCGCLFCAYLNRGRIELGLSPLGAIGMTLSLIGIYHADPLAGAFECSCAMLGFFGSLFFVPLNGYLQDQAGDHERGRVLAASNLLTQLAGISLIGVHAWFSNVLQLNAKEEVFILILPLGLVAGFTCSFLLEDLLRAICQIFLKIFYRIQVIGIENFPDQGGVLIVSNHLSYADPVFIGAAYPRKVRYLAHLELAQSRFLDWIFRLTQTQTLSSNHSLSAFKKSIKHLQKGIALCLFAEGGISRLGVVLPFRRGPILLAQKGRVPIIPVYLDGVWGSIYSNQGGHFFTKLPKAFPYSLTVRSGKPLDPSSETPESVRRAVLDLGVLSFNQRINQGMNPLQSLRKAIFRNTQGILFRSMDGSVIEREQFLIAVEREGSGLPNPYQAWARQVHQVLTDGGRAEVCQPWVNWMRLKETNLLEHLRLEISFAEKVWNSQWFPWFPLLGQFGFEEMTTNRWARIVDGNVHGGRHLVSGYASKQNGLVSLQLPYDKTSSLIQSGTKQNTLGLLLPGYSYKMESGTFILCGVGQPEKLFGVGGMDEDGFLLSK